MSIHLWKPWGENLNHSAVLRSSQHLANSDNAGMFSETSVTVWGVEGNGLFISCSCYKIDSDKCEMDVSHWNSEKKTPKQL